MPHVASLWTRTLLTTCLWGRQLSPTAVLVQVSARAVFVVGPDKKLKLSILYPATTGRNFREVSRHPDLRDVTPLEPHQTSSDVMFDPLH